MAGVLLADIRQQLRDFAGKLNEIVDETVRPTLYWWEYMPGLWLGYIIRDKGYWFWRNRRIIVAEVEEHSPDPGLPASARS
jgi:hypothetical protein